MLSFCSYVLYYCSGYASASWLRLAMSMASGLCMSLCGAHALAALGNGLPGPTAFVDLAVPVRRRVWRILLPMQERCLIITIMRRR